MRNEYPKTKEIIYLLGMGTLLVATIALPGLGHIAAMIDKTKRDHDWKQQQKEWNKFNLPLLKRNLKRLNDQKVIEIIEENGQEVIKLTQKGRVKFLKYKLEENSLANKKWDKRWRIITYDVSKFKKSQRDGFRNFLKYTNFLSLHKSVYITPMPCEEQISYLREYFGIGDEVILIRADRIENEEVFKQYFGL